MLPCTSTSSRVPALRWSMSMFCVITASSRPRALELDQRAVRPVGQLLAERREALAVEAPEAHRVLAKRVDVRDLHRVDVLPQPRAAANGSRESPRERRCRRPSAPRPSPRRAPARPARRSRTGVRSAFRSDRRYSYTNATAAFFVLFAGSLLSTVTVMSAAPAFPLRRGSHSRAGRRRTAVDRRRLRLADLELGLGFANTNPVPLSVTLVPPVAGPEPGVTFVTVGSRYL